MLQSSRKRTAWLSATVVTNSSGNCLPSFKFFAKLLCCSCNVFYSCLRYAKIEYVSVRSTYVSFKEQNTCTTYRRVLNEWINDWLVDLNVEGSSRFRVSLLSSRMRVIYHNWSATKQRPHPQSVAEISHHSVLSRDRIRQCETSSGSRHKDTDQCL